MSVSHELKTPLTAIHGYAQAVQDGAAIRPARGRSDNRAARRHRLERLVHDLLDLAHEAATTSASTRAR